MASERLILGYAPALTNRLHLLVFGSTLLVYNTPRIIRKPNTGNPLKRQYRQWYFILFFMGFVLAVAGMYRQSVVLQLASIVLGIFAFAYFLPVLPFKNKRRLRDFGSVKIIVLAGVWTTATSVLPMLFWQKNISSYPLEIFIRLVFIFTLCVVFDIRDIRADVSNNINTLPNKVGLRNSYLLINFMLLLFVALSVVQYGRYPSAARLAGALLTALVTKMVVIYLRRHPSEKAYLFLADGVMLVYSALVLLN
jgi:4-hydroxybenzoate polyprenyltransferase